MINGLTKIKFLMPVVFAICFVFLIPAYNLEAQDDGAWRIKNPLQGGNDVFGFVIVISNWLFNIAGFLVVIFIIIVGLRFMLSAGRPSEIQAARKMLLWLFVGFAVVLVGKGFIALIANFLGGAS